MLSIARFSVAQAGCGGPMTGRVASNFTVFVGVHSDECQLGSMGCSPDAGQPGSNTGLTRLRPTSVNGANPASSKKYAEGSGTGAAFSKLKKLSDWMVA